MNTPLQVWIFNQIFGQFTKKSDGIDAIGKLLSVSKDAVYRRSRGDTVLTPDELHLLSKTFGLSIDKYIYGADDVVFFSYRPVAQKAQTFEGYLNNLYQQIATDASIKIKYASPAIPVFYLCFFPELIAFKLYTWACTSWDINYLKESSFDFDLIPYPILEQAKFIVDRYIDIPSTELWSLNLIDFTINQIEYYTSSNAFANEDISLILCDKLVELLNHMEEMARVGQKFKVGGKPKENGARFKLFHNEMLYTDHTVLVNSNVGQIVYTSFGNPDFASSKDQRMTHHINLWFDKLLYKSEAISEHAEKSRKRYFNRLRKKVEVLKTKIEMNVLS